MFCFIRIFPYVKGHGHGSPSWATPLDQQLHSLFVHLLVPGKIVIGQVSEMGVMGRFAGVGQGQAQSVTLEHYCTFDECYKLLQVNFYARMALLITFRVLVHWSFLRSLDFKWRTSVIKCWGDAIHCWNQIWNQIFISEVWNSFHWRKRERERVYVYLQ